MTMTSCLRGTGTKKTSAHPDLSRTAINARHINCSFKIIFVPFFYRVAKTDRDDAAREVSADDNLDAFYPDDQQLIYQTDRRSPRRWFLPSPQGMVFFSPSVRC